jgi:hypothetical protein
MPEISKTTEVHLFNLSDLQDPAWNPRHYLDETKMADLKAYVVGGNPIPPLMIWKGNGQAPWTVISGKRRREAYRRAGKTQIEGIILDISLQAAKILAIASNQDDKPYWLDEYMAVEALLKEDPQLEQQDLARQLGWSNFWVTRAVNLTEVLNPASRQLIEQSLRKPFRSSKKSGLKNHENTPQKTQWQLREGVAYRLTTLLDHFPPQEAQTLAEKALSVMLTHQLSGPQTEELVTYALAGNDPAQFEPTNKVRKARSNKKTPGESVSIPFNNPAPVPHIPANPNHTAHAIASPAAAASGEEPLKESKVSSIEPNKPSWFWEWMVGISFINQLRSKVKKGEKLTLTERLFVLGYKFLKVLVPMLKPMGRLLKKAFKGIGHLIKKVFGKTFSEIIQLAFILLIICALIWGAGKVYQLVVVNPLHWLESKVVSGFHWRESKPEETTTPISTPQPITSTIAPQIQSAISHLIPKKKLEKPASTIAYQPAVSFNTTASPLNSTGTLYDPKILESEIQSLPVNCVVKDFPLTPDEGMPGDLAVSRMQDLTDPDKYTMKIGSGKQVILSVNATTTNLIVHYKSTDAIGGFLDGGGLLNFFWEDVKYIHANEIDIQTKIPSIIYQCSLVVSGSKNPLTIQCASPEDLEHLVSTMQYFIRSSRLTHDTALTGMPYPSQGLRLNNGCVVEKLWTGSPMEKAGVHLGDMIWSVEKNAGLPPERKALETQLSALTASAHNLFVVSPLDREKAQIEMNQNHTSSLNPKRRKVEFTTS